MRNIIFLGAAAFLLIACAESKNTRKVSSSDTQKTQESNPKSAAECKSLENPKERAECAVMSAIKDKSNISIIEAVEALEKSGLKASGEVGSIFIGGECDQSSSCTYNYLVSTDYYSASVFKTILVEVKSPLGADAIPTIVRVVNLN